MVIEPLKPCWACRKARLVCDFAKPACRKCQARGTECPGYDSKPLVWIPNGTVKAKQRKNDRKKEQQTNPQQGLVKKPRKKLAAPSGEPLWTKRPPLSFGLSELAIQIIQYCTCSHAPAEPVTPLTGLVAQTMYAYLPMWQPPASRVPATRTLYPSRSRPISRLPCFTPCPALS